MAIEEGKAVLESRNCLTELLAFAMGDRGAVIARQDRPRCVRTQQVHGRTNDGSAGRVYLPANGDEDEQH